MRKSSSNIKRQYLANTNDASVCNLHMFLNKKFSKTHRKIIVVTDDHLGGNSLFLPSLYREPTAFDQIISVASLYPEFEFTVIHSCLNIPDTVSNITFVCQGPGMFLDGDNYLYLKPQAEKSFAESYFWISLNGNRRVHRYLTSMFLLGSNVEDYGLLRLDPTEILSNDSWESYLSWWQYNERPEILDVEPFYPVLKKGFYKIKNLHGFESRIYSSTSTPIDNSENFDQYLRKLYSNTAVEIVNETVWFPDPGGVLSEKYLNSVYGFNFPIIISVRNTVSYLRELGFDMFDDIIDHSYDSIASPTVRLVSALNSNLHLLRDRQLAVNAWKQCQSRMHKNVEIAKELEKCFKA
jgi:hypothetical protein